MLYKVAFAGFHEGAGLRGLVAHVAAEWVVLANLFGLLMGFALLSRHFEESHVPAKLPDYLPDDWRGAFLLLVIVFVLGWALFHTTWGLRTRSIGENPRAADTLGILIFSLAAISLTRTTRLVSESMTMASM